MSKPKITETDIRHQVRDCLRAKGWFVFHILQGLGAYKGITDLIAAKNSRIVFIELKTKTGKQSDYQKQFQSDLEAAGGEYILCRGIDDLIERGI